MSKNPTKRGAARDLSLETIVAAALAEMDVAGEAGFSLRRVAARLGRDPMAVLYHVGSKEALERAVADALNAEVLPMVDASLPWRPRLEAVAYAYRAVAHRHPRAFPMLLRFWTTGPADFRVAEAVYAALAEAGFGAEETADYGCGLYAAVLGLCAGEVGGLLAPPPPALLAEMAATSPAEFPALHRLLGAVHGRDADALFHRTLGVLLDGIAAARSARVAVKPSRR